LYTQDHPYTGTPVYFIHPCHTASVLEASIDPGGISPYKYLVLWISAICSSVGLNIPLELVVDRDCQTPTDGGK
jgi:ubiquitin-like-conjugating enzyme ATG10